MNRSGAILIDSINWNVEETDDITNIIFLIYLSIYCYLCYSRTINEFIEIRHLLPKNWGLTIYTSVTQSGNW